MGKVQKKDLMMMIKKDQNQRKSNSLSKMTRWMSMSKIFLQKNSQNLLKKLKRMMMMMMMMMKMKREKVQKVQKKAEKARKARKARKEKMMTMRTMMREKVHLISLVKVLVMVLTSLVKVLARVWMPSVKLVKVLRDSPVRVPIWSRMLVKVLAKWLVMLSKVQKVQKKDLMMMIKKDQNQRKSNSLS